VTDTLLTFGPFQLRPARQSLLRDGNAVRLGSRALNLLTVLVERAGELVSKDELARRVWPGMVVEDANLRVHVSALRKILGDGGAGERFINTVAGRGYCFVARVGRTHDAVAADPSVGAAAALGNLPAPLTRTIGRDQAIGMIAKRTLRHRFVTIVGPGGIGKTTVAVAVAGNLVGSYRHQVCFVDLGRLADHRLVASTLASVLGVALSTEDPLPGLLAYLRSKSVLIVLDNCEHVIDSAAVLAEGILKGAKGVHLLATSREPLRAEGEWVYRLSSLAVPPRSARMSLADALAFPAIELFVERATAALDTFELDDADAATVCQICRRLDGIPLAIELAAAHINLFSVREFAARLADGVSLLTAGRRTALPRHRTLRATLDWSHALLSDAERIGFRRLAVMAGQFTMEAAVAVVADATVPASNVLEVMAGLVGKSLITTDVGGKAIQYRLLETTRAYAAEKLAQSCDAEPSALRYAMYYRDLVQRGEAEWKVEAGAEWLSTYAGNIDDIRAAIDWAFAPAGDLPVGLDLIAASAQVWFQLSLMAEYRERVERALQRLTAASEPNDFVEMRLRAGLGHALWYTANEPDRMEHEFARALLLAERVGDRYVQLQALWGLWAVRRGRGEYRAGLEVASRYEAIARGVGDRRFIILGDRILGLTNHFLGNQTLARQHVERVRTQSCGAKPTPNTDWQVDSRIAMPTLLARIQWIQGFPDQAMATAQEAIAAAQQADHWFSLCYVLYTAACPLSLWLGSLEETHRHLSVLAARAAGNAAVEAWRQSYALILRLRQGGEGDSLIASFLEPRMELSKTSEVAALASLPAIPVPLPEAEPADALWSLPEVLRVDAELLLWHGVSNAAEAAETKLLRSLDLARQQSALSWELRSAMSLARLWRRVGRAAEARELLAATSDRFTEGFGTDDVAKARRLVEDWDKPHSSPHFDFGEQAAEVGCP
jgi:predicted ATPase/DNA-binding winged helix-turn-helix (wHTH) protein